MNALSFQAGRHASLHCDPCSSDCQPPDHRAHRRGFILILIVFALAVVAAVICGVVKGVSDMGAAFPTVSALTDVAAWDRFFAGFGRFAAVVVGLVVGVALLRRRRKRPPKQ